MKTKTKAEKPDAPKGKLRVRCRGAGGRFIKDGGPVGDHPWIEVTDDTGETLLGLRLNFWK